MVIAVSAQAAMRHSAPRHANGTIPAYRVEYIGARPATAQAGRGQPQAFAIDMHPLQEFASHYHVVPQYQVVMQGTGSIGRRELQAYAVHFTDEYTAYGPLRAGDAGMRYMTLRADADPGPQYIAELEARGRMRPSRKRFCLHSGIGTTEAAALVALDSPAIEPLIERDEDGVVAVAVRLGPGMAYACESPAHGGGQFIMVMNGSLVRDGEVLGQDSTVFVSSTDPALELTASAHGADVLFMQYPRRHGEAG